MEVAYTICDECGKEVSYMDSDGDRYNAGLTITGDLAFSGHFPTSSGYSGGGIDNISITHICSPKCLTAIFDKTLVGFQVAWDSPSRIEVKDGQRIKNN
jgi:hypothetical protein